MMDFDQLFPNRDKARRGSRVLEQLPRLNWDFYFEENDEDLMGDIHSSAVVAEHVRVGEGTVISPFCQIEKNVFIGENCVIRSGVLIRENSVIGDNVVIGHNSEIKHSYIFAQAKVGSHVFIGDSVIGYGARIGSGVIIGNRRFDQQPIQWHLPDGAEDSGQDKVGALVGDYCRIGSNATTNPGTIIGAYTWVTGANSLSGFIPARKFIKPKGEMVDNQNAGELKARDSQGDL